MEYTQKAPYSQSYWVLPGQFLAGQFPGDKSQQVMNVRMAALLDAGIRAIINLIKADENDHDTQLFSAYMPIWLKLGHSRGIDVFYKQVPMQDLSVPDEDTMIKVLDLIDSFLAEQLPVYIHCWAGRGRTGTVVGCWLVRHGIVNGHEAVDRIKELRKHEETAHMPSPETAQQIGMVRTWQKGK